MIDYLFFFLFYFSFFLKLISDMFNLYITITYILYGHLMAIKSFFILFRYKL